MIRNENCPYELSKTSLSSCPLFDVEGPGVDSDSSASSDGKAVGPCRRVVNGVCSLFVSIGVAVHLRNCFGMDPGKGVDAAHLIAPKSPSSGRRYR